MAYKSTSLVLLVIVTLTISASIASAEDPIAYLKSPKIDPVVAEELIDNGYSEAIIILSSNDEYVKNSVASIVGNGNVISTYRNIPYMYARVDLNSVPRLATLGYVAFIAPNIVFKKASLDRMILLDYHKLQSYTGVPALVNWGLFRTGAVAVWREFNMTGDGVIIAILDTGVNIAHPLIRGKMFTLNSSDPSYPGGWIEFDSKGRPVCSSPHDTDGHGSWVTSIAVGGDGNDLLIGYAPHAMYIHALVLPTGSGTFAQVLAGIDWAAEPYLCNGTRVSSILGRPFRPDIVSMSFGSEGNYSNYLLPAIRRLLELGIVPVAAIGNGGIYTSSNPGNIWGVFGVGSVERDDSVSLFSSGEYVEWPDPPQSWPFKGRYPKEYYKPDFVLPGVMIPGAYLSEDLIAIGSGTSAGAPSLSGILALAIQALRSKGVNASPSALYDLISETSYRADNMSKIRYGNGVANAFTLVARVLGYRLSIIDGSSDSDIYRVGSRGSFNIEGFQGSFTLYLDDQRFQGSGGRAAFTVPPSDYGDHYLHAFSLERGIYSYKRIRVEPSIAALGSYYSGNEVLLRLDGFPAAELIVIRYTGTQTLRTMGDIIAIDYPNLRGRIDLSIRLPYVSSPQSVYIVASDLIGLIGASIGISINPPQLQQAATTSGQLQLIVSGPQTIYLGEPINISLYTYSEGRGVTSNITAYVYYIDNSNSSPTLILKIQRFADNLRINITPNSTGLYVVWAAARSDPNLVGEAMYAFRVLSYEEASQIAIVVRNISILSAQITSINSSVERVIADLVDRYSNLYMSINTLSRELNETKKQLLKTQEDLSAALRTVEELSTLRAFMWVVIALAIASIAVALAVIARARGSRR